MIEVDFCYFCKYSMPLAFSFVCDDFFTMEVVSVMANFPLSASFVLSSSTFEMSKLLSLVSGTLIEDMVDKVWSWVFHP